MFLDCPWWERGRESFCFYLLCQLPCDYGKHQAWWVCCILDVMPWVAIYLNITCSLHSASSLYSTLTVGLPEQNFSYRMGPRNSGNVRRWEEEVENSGKAWLWRAGFSTNHPRLVWTNSLLHHCTQFSSACASI